jgi:hypothetical protein
MAFEDAELGRFFLSNGTTAEVVPSTDTTPAYINTTFITMVDNDGTDVITTVWATSLAVFALIVFCWLTQGPNPSLTRRRGGGDGDCFCVDSPPKSTRTPQCARYGSKRHFRSKK